MLSESIEALAEMYGKLMISAEIFPFYGRNSVDPRKEKLFYDIFYTVRSRKCFLAT